MSVGRAGIATAGHNIANAATEGFSRQRVESEAIQLGGGFDQVQYGDGARIARVDRIHDSYMDKQIRSSMRDMGQYEEKDILLTQLEDVFNELGGDGLNHRISLFFNDFRRLSEEPQSTAVRESVRESAQALVGDFRRVYDGVKELQGHMDSRLEQHVRELNGHLRAVAHINDEVRKMQAGSGVPNDLIDKRDTALKHIASYMDIATFEDNHGNVQVIAKNIGPIVTGGEFHAFQIAHTPGTPSEPTEDDTIMTWKGAGAVDISTTANVQEVVTHSLHTGKLGGLIETRDKTASSIIDRLDAIAFGISQQVNALHSSGVAPDGRSGIAFFRDPVSQFGAGERFALSDLVADDAGAIVSAFEANAPGDNRIALAIADLQLEKTVASGPSMDAAAYMQSFDDAYNGIVSGIGMLVARNRDSLHQQKDISTALEKVREELSGVSVDEETTTLLQFQHIFDASAKVIQIADELLKTILSLTR